MSFNVNFGTAYAAGPSTTTIFTVTGVAQEVGNVFLKIFATNEDTTNPPHLVDQSFFMVWNGSTFSTPPTAFEGSSSPLYEWNVSGSTATFDFSPTSGMPASIVSVDLIVVPNGSAVSVNY